MSGYHYLLSDESGNVKLGYTGRRPHRRVSSYVQASARVETLLPDRLSSLAVLAIRPGTHEWERSFHSRHYSQRILGEWYPPASRATIEAVSGTWHKPDVYMDHDHCMLDYSSGATLWRSMVDKINFEHVESDPVGSEKYNENWDISSIPDSVLMAAAAKVMQRGRKERSGGRPKVMRECPNCGLSFSARDMLRHSKSKCKS